MKPLVPQPTERKNRLAFVSYWAEYVRTHEDADWSKQQKVLIDSQLQSARAQPLSAKAYLKIKEAGKTAGRARLFSR